MKNLVKPVGILAALTLSFSSTVATAATASYSSPNAAAASISPFVALSAYGTMQSRSAVCAAAIGTAGAAAAAAAGQAAGPGCVLPVVDPAAPVVVDAAPLPPVGVAVAPAGFGFGVGAILAGLIAVAGLAAVLLSKGDNNDRLPISAA